MPKIQFCPKCGKILDVKNESNLLIGLCSCGFVKKINSEIYFSEKTIKDIRGKGIAEDKGGKEGFPHVCKKCGHTQCDIHDLGAPYSDESNIYLFKCKKCGYVERQADGSGNK